MKKQTKEDNCVVRDAITNELILRTEANKVEILDGSNKTTGFTTTSITRVQVVDEPWGWNTKKFFRVMEVEVNKDGELLSTINAEASYDRLLDEAKKLKESEKRKGDAFFCITLGYFAVVLILACGLAVALGV